MTGALDGIRVVDHGLLVHGPQAASTLGDLGADVVKVELPAIGDQARHIPLSSTDRRAPFFVATNRGKRSITIDLRRPAGADVFRRLAGTADVVISNFKPGTLTGEPNRRANRGHPLIPMLYGIFPTADHCIALVGVPSHLREAFLVAIERPDLADDPRFAPGVLEPETKRSAFAELAALLADGSC